ncbi:amidohydrolase family protein [Flavobacteriaceae bacterium]|nr:amidohydrolase family protein [Flavobacteriaceae bacterium]
MKKTIYLISLFCLNIVATAQQTPAPSQSESILIQGATLHIGDGTIIENGSLGIEAGKIVEVGSSSDIKNNYKKIINAKDQHVYPGFIAANSTVGMVEIDAIRPTNDLNEIGTFLPNIRTLIAYNAESKVVESLRPNGILTAQIIPTRGRIAGSSTVVQLDAWNWEDAALKTDEGMHIYWPRSYRRGNSTKGEDPLVYDQKNYDKQIQELDAYLNEAKTFTASAEKKHLPHAALQAMFNGNQQVYLHAKEKRQILDGIVFLQKHGLKKIVLVGGDDAHLILPFLKKNDIPVIVSRPHRLPNTADEDVKLPFKMAKILMDAGLTITIDVSGRMERMNTRNLPFYAGTFAAYGVDKEKAVQMITLNAAKILGIDDRLGSLEKGKEATLFIAVGDALDMRTNQLSHAFIQGRALLLETHQTELWKRYMEKFSRK